jgi:Tol biopolymer transport system component
MASVSWSVLALVAAALFLCVAGDLEAAFPGANGRIAFESERDGNPEIYSMEPDASDQTRLTRNPASDTDPAWSPDGTRIVFTSNRDGNDEIYTMNADGTGQTRLTTSPGSDSNPSWSPDGRNIVFASRRDGQAEIYVMNADGTGQTRLTDNTAPDAVPAWSPDGSKIAFTSARDGQNEIYAMNVDGSSQTRLTTDPGSDVSPAWSPDGKKIAFASNRDGNYEIYVMKADGTDQTRLTRNLDVDLDPAWSPDGTQIAFTTNRDGNYEIYRMDADGTSQTRLTTNQAPDATADWQPVLIKYIVRTATLRGRWRQSVYSGSLVLAGRVDAPVKSLLVLRKAQREVLPGSLDLVAGSYQRELRLPPGLLPGTYTLDVEPDPTSGFAAQHLAVPLAAPLEGVVSRGWSSSSPGGSAISRFPRSATIAYVNFQLAAKPNRSLRLTIACYRPGGSLVGPPKPKPPVSLIVSAVRNPTGGPIPRGAYSCTLDAGAVIVKRVRFTIG